jgi:hypothetical protein
VSSRAAGAVAREAPSVPSARASSSNRRTTDVSSSRVTSPDLRHAIRPVVSSTTSDGHARIV